MDSNFLRDKNKPEDKSEIHCYGAYTLKTPKTQVMELPRNHQKTKQFFFCFGKKKHSKIQSKNTEKVVITIFLKKKIVITI